MAFQMIPAIAALAPLIWGSTYLTTTELLPPGHPIGAACLRALPAGLLLLLITRRLPPRDQLWRLLVLGALNFAIFWSLLFVAAYRLPGGVAATMGAAQPLMVLLLARFWLGAPLAPLALAAAFGGGGGVALLALGPGAALNSLGVAAALGGAASMAAGVVLTRKWRAGAPLVAFTAWQLIAGGLLLAPAALLLEPSLPAPTPAHLAGFAWLALAGGAVSYLFWFAGIAQLGPEAVTMLGFLSPLTATVLGWAALGERMSAVQAAGAAILLLSVWAGQRAARPRHEAVGSP